MEARSMSAWSSAANSYCKLQSFTVDHDHGPIGNREDRPDGNGVLLWFVVDDFEAVLERASAMEVGIALPRPTA